MTTRPRVGRPRVTLYPILVLVWWANRSFDWVVKDGEIPTRTPQVGVCTDRIYRSCYPWLVLEYLPKSFPSKIVSQYGGRRPPSQLRFLRIHPISTVTVTTKLYFCVKTSLSYLSLFYISSQDQVNYWSNFFNTFKNHPKGSTRIYPYDQSTRIWTILFYFKKITVKFRQVC